MSERHARRRASFDGALELPVMADGDVATLRAAREGRPFGEYDKLVLHHGQTALAFELSRRRAVSAAELRLAGDLLEDLEGERLDEREASRRMAAFREPRPAMRRSRRPEQRAKRRGDPARGRRGARAQPRPLSLHGETRPRRVPRRSRDRGRDHRPGGADRGRRARSRRRRQAGARPRPALLEARAALDGRRLRCLVPRPRLLELLLSLPDAALEAFVDRVLGPAADSERLMDSLAALLDSGCRWSDAAEALGVHRHTLRYRMERLREQTGRHPDDPSERMELWLALKARQALAARNAVSPRTG